MARYRFGNYIVDTDTVEVIGPDGVREVEPQVFHVLQYLVEQPDRLITKEELLDNIWGDRFVSESALTTRIKQARKALDDDGRTQWAIKTVHGRGYRFVATQDPVAPAPTGLDPAIPAGPAANPLPDDLRADARHMFVGRQAELETSVALLSDPVHRHSFAWLWLLGEPGIGKTRLATEVASEAQKLGQQVLFGRNNEDLRVPFQPFIEVIRSSIERADPGERDAVIDHIPAELDPLLPWKRLPAEAAQGHADDQTKRFRLFEAMATWLVSYADRAPVTMIIDDVHWAADSTLQLLAHLQQRVQDARVTFVLTARDTAPDINARVLDLLSTGQGSPNTTVVRLDGLNGEDAVKLVGTSVELADVMQQTAGNPLLLQAVNPEDGTVDIRDAVHRRWAGVNDAVRETLQVCSILGLEFTLDIAATATGRDELDLLSDLEHAIAARLLDDLGGDRFRFTHAMIRSALRDGLGHSRRARMHLRIADAIDTMFADDPEHLHALAYHSAEAAAVDAKLGPRAVQRLDAAAKRAVEQLSFAEAADALQRAHELTNPNERQLRARLTLDRGIALTRAGASMTAARVFETALAESEFSGDPLLQIESAIRYEDASWRPGISGLDALRHLEEAEDVLTTAVTAGVLVDNESELRARLAIGKLRAAAMSGQTSKAEESFGRAHQLVQTLGSATLEASLLNVYVSQIRLFKGIDSEVAALVDRIAELRPSLPDGDIALHAIHVEALYAQMVGRHHDAKRLTRVREAMQEETHSTFWKFIRINQIAMEAFYEGDLDAAEEGAERCLELADALPEEDGSGSYGVRMFLIRREQDRLLSMAPLLRRVMAQDDATSVWTPGLALLLAETGSIDEAAAVFADIKGTGFKIPNDSMWTTVMVLVMETAVHLGDLEACELLRTKFSPLAGTNVVMGSGLHCFGWADRFLGTLSLQLGELDAAEDYLGRSLEADSAGGSSLYANESRLWLSRVRREQGYSAEANAMAEVVVREASSRGHLRLQRLASTDLKTN